MRAPRIESTANMFAGVRFSPSDFPSSTCKRKVPRRVMAASRDAPPAPPAVHLLGEDGLGGGRHLGRFREGPEKLPRRFREGSALAADVTAEPVPAMKDIHEKVSSLSEARHGEIW